jgi:hypothetical protein
VKDGSQDRRHLDFIGSIGLGVRGDDWIPDWDSFISSSEA